MKKGYSIKNESSQRQFLMQELQINAFSELSNYVNKKLEKLFKLFSR